ADLQNVVVGGSIQIRTNSLSYGELNAIRIAPNTLANNSPNTNTFTEERTRLSIRADFTDNVDAFIEFDSYDVWGTDFRSNYLTGVDSRPTGNVNVYQAYIEAKEMWGTPLKLKAGRQEIKLGSGWLVGTGGTAPYFFGRSFDALRLTYATDQFSVDAIAAKLLERSPIEEDGDIDFYAVYGSYLGIQDVALDAYWMFVRDAVGDISHNLDIHTFGLRGAGTVDAFDFNVEGAYQLVDQQTLKSVDTFAGTLEAGYTLDMKWTPRVFVGGAYFDGGKDGAFDRLFSDTRYSTILDGGMFAGTKLTGFWTASVGASVMPIESLKLQLSGAYLKSVGNDGIDKEELGWELGASAVYSYSHDWVSRWGYSHLFASSDMGTSGSLMFSGFDTGKVVVLDDVDYFYMESKVSF
ncbi:MAG: alginate export family protein, partial [Candidatus Hydrogenedentes bacterium]|nr:alginate export family protein [Candidatus Hydrogenedentota bacterium]